MPALKLAIVGGGPSSFYVASRLLQLLPATSELGSALRIHIYDRLWAPHGLVRYGVAPDHPEVKVWHSYKFLARPLTHCISRIVHTSLTRLEKTLVLSSSGM